MEVTWRDHVVVTWRFSWKVISEDAKNKGRRKKGDGTARAMIGDEAGEKGEARRRYSEVTY